MDDDRESVIVGPGTDQACSQGEVVGEIEGGAGEFEIAHGLVGVGDGQIDVDVGGVVHLDARGAVDLDHRAAQRFVAGDDVDERGMQCVHIEFADEAHRERDVVVG